MSRSPPCPYFTRCGGCSLQDKEYPEQLLLKQERVSAIFNQQVVVHPAPSEFGYRSRMDFIISSRGIGLRPKGKSFELVDINECVLISKKANLALAAFRKAISTLDVPAYNLRSHEGFLRYLSFRESSDGRLMAILTTTTPAVEQELVFKKFLQDSAALVDTLHWCVIDTKADDFSTMRIKETHGDKSFSTSLAACQFSLGPATFFQSNHAVAEEMVDKIASLAKGKVLDLFCGVGTISLPVAKYVDSVVGVELSKDSIDAARQNAKLNDITNATFFAEPADEFVKHSLLAKDTFETIIVDPPRTGLGPTLARALPRLGANTLIYMSCNPSTLRDDLQPLLKRYDLISLEGWDMFPQTAHLEVLAVLRKR